MSENSDRAILNKIGQPATAEVVAVSGASAATAAALVEGATYLITSTIAFHFKAAAAAATTDTYWPAGVPLYVTMDDAVQLAFIKAAAAADANVFVTRLKGHGV